MEVRNEEVDEQRGAAGCVVDVRWMRHYADDILSWRPAGGDGRNSAD
jgi:hypothetical protein